MLAYLCSSCGQRFVWAGEETENSRPWCPCGGTLAPALLTPGQHELADSEAKEPTIDDGSRPVEEEADLGYSRSHGYYPGHGGPSGPGDASAQ